MCIRFLLQEKKHTPYEIASILKTSDSTVYRTRDLIQKQNMWMLDEIDERKFALEIIQTAIAASARLFRQGKNREAWTVEKEAIDVLQSLGFLKKQPLEFKGSLTLQEILKLANADREDEPGVLREPGSRVEGFLKNGSS